MIDPLKKDPSPSFEKGEAIVEDYHFQEAGATQFEKKLSLLGAISLGYIVLATWIAFSSSVASALASGGANTLFWGLLIVVICNLAGALSLAEPASLWPSSSGQTVWVYNMSSQKWAPLAAYITSWTVIFGWGYLGLASELLCSQMILAMVVITRDSFTIETWHVSVMMCTIAILMTYLGMIGSKLVSKLNTALLVWSICGLFAMSLTLLITSRGNYNTAHFAFVEIINLSGWKNPVIPWLVGLTQAALSTTAFDTVAHFAEEIDNPARNVPIAMVASIGINGLIGLAYAAVLVFCIPTDVVSLLSSSTGFPFAQVLLDKTGSPAATVVLLFVLLVPFLLALMDCNMTAGRALQVFAREEGLPFKNFFIKINKRFDAPINATAVILLVQSGLAFIYVGNSAALFAFLSTPTVALALSYGIVAAFMLFRGRPVLKLQPAYNLGRFWGPICNVVTVIFTLLLTVALCLPSAYPVTKVNMNYTSVILAFSLFLAVASWYSHGKRHYKGPEAV